MESIKKLRDGMPTFGTEIVCRRVGCTHREIIHWCNEGVFGDKFVRPGQGYKHEFSELDVQRVKIVNRVAKITAGLTASKTRGAGMKTLKNVNEFLLENPDAKEMFISFDVLGNAHISRYCIARDYLRIRLDD